MAKDSEGQMTRDDWLKRCETIWNKGLARPNLMSMMTRWLDAVMRYEHTMFSSGQSQGNCWIDFVNAEFGRTDGGRRTLANDADGYALQEIAAILSHPCQRCAEDKEAWHTRPGFCNHRDALAAKGE